MKLPEDKVNTDLLLPILAGMLLSLPFLAVAQRAGTRGPRVLAIGLVVAAAIYVALATARGSSQTLLLETGGIVLFAGIATAGVRLWVPLLAAGWVLHVAWDLFFHSISESSYVPSWYPLLCAGFDLFVAGWAARLGPGSSTHLASSRPRAVA